MLEPRLQAEILRLHFSQNLSRRKIAQQLGVDRKTVGEIVERRQVRLPAGERNPRSSILEPHYPRIQKLLDDAPERSSVNILQRLRDAGYTGGVSILRDYVRSLRPQPQPEAFFDLEFAKGEAAQVDWGEFGDVFGNGTKVHAFVMVLCWSRCPRRWDSRWTSTCAYSSSEAGCTACSDGRCEAMQTPRRGTSSEI